MMKRDKKDEESGGAANPFLHSDKTTVLQEARVFNETPINSKKCCQILTKLLYILMQGETLNRTEATEVFFAVTKLWQSKDATLRRLVYLAIKELSSMADDVIIVTSSLTKDMTGKEDIYRAAAVRALCKITDSSMFQAIDRYMKQAIVDKSPAVASAALVSSLHIMKKNPEIVRRWVNEVQEAVSSENPMVQYHALIVLYHIRKSDRLAVIKMIQKYSKQNLKSPYAVCYLIKLAVRLIDEDNVGVESLDLVSFLESCLRHKHETVIYEATTAIVRLTSLASKELSTAVSVLQLLLSSPKPSMRFAAVRTLNKVAMTHPNAVMNCNIDLEQLITDQNRSIATLAITTLLKTGAESSVDRLMKQISTFVSEISDEFKIVVIEAIRSLCLRYPRKHIVMMQFLSTMLREDGGYEYKKEIVDTLIAIIEDNPEAKEAGLAYLCEFIEDCEHFVLATKILHLFGREGSRAACARKYIRYIYNRVILENAQVRAAAVSALAKFGAHNEALRQNICVLLTRCLLDSDDEVRDRATFYLTVLLSNNTQFINQYILEGLQVSVVGLEKALQAYCSETHSKPFDLKSVPLASQPITASVLEERRTAVIQEKPMKRDEKPKATVMEVYAEQLKAIPEFSNLGVLFKSSEISALTESEVEYVVGCVKHIFPERVVLQFDCRNTLNDQLLENVSVMVEPDNDNWKVKSYVPIPKLAFNQPASAYALLEPIDSSAVVGSFSCTMKYLVKDCDPVTGEPDTDEGYNDEYVLEDIEINVADYVQRTLKTNFQAFWTELGDANHVEDTYALSTISSLEDAVKKLQQYLGLGVCERSDRIGEGKASHTLLMSGVFRAGFDVAARAKLALTPDGVVNLNLSVRSTDPTVSELIASAIG